MGWVEVEDDLACTIDISEYVAGKENEVKDTRTSYGFNGCNNLWSLLGADDERRPETDPFDLGLSLESPDIQRWADEEGWTEVMDAAARQDSGWDSDADGGEREEGKTLSKKQLNGDLNEW